LCSGDVVSGNDINHQETDQMNYETPTITELGSVADFTRADRFAFAFDGFLFHGSDHGHGTPTS
jgi:hypothetical protein